MCIRDSHRNPAAAKKHTALQTTEFSAGRMEHSAVPVSYTHLGGIGLDVFSNEHDFSLAVQKGQVETVNNRVAAALVLLQMAESRMGNIYVQPHQGFNSDLAVESKAADTISHMISWYQNGKKRFDEQLPYYQDVI